MIKFEKLARLNEDIEILEACGDFKSASVLHNKFIREAQQYAGQESAYQMATPVNYNDPQLNAQIQANRVNNVGDVANQMQAQNTMPNPVYQENQLYQTSIQEIARLLNTKLPENRMKAQQIYENTFVQFKDPRRKQAFAKQFQSIVSRNFPAGPIK
jgi:hypothetical protein